MSGGTGRRRSCACGSIVEPFWCSSLSCNSQMSFKALSGEHPGATSWQTVHDRRTDSLDRLQLANRMQYTWLKSNDEAGANKQIQPVAALRASWTHAMRKQCGSLGVGGRGSWRLGWATPEVVVPSCRGPVHRLEATTAWFGGGWKAV